MLLIGAIINSIEPGQGLPASASDYPCRLMTRTVGVVFMVGLGAYDLAIACFPRHPLNRGAYGVVRLSPLSRFGFALVGVLSLVGAAHVLSPAR